MGRCVNPSSHTVDGARRALLNVHAIHNMLSRANVKHVGASSALRADSLLGQYI